ncbi:MAG: efflux RND transporter periplasmic adaptor subunit [Desulfamplus sp.]
MKPTNTPNNITTQLDTGTESVAIPPAESVEMSPDAVEKSDLATLLAEPASRAWYRSPILWSALFLLAVVAAGLWYWQKRQTANDPPSYITQTVARGNLTLTVTANGTLEPTRLVSIGSELSGTVLKVNVDVNDHISKGDVLVELDTAKLNDQILRSHASLAAAKAKVAQTVATVKEAKLTLARFEEVSRLSGGKVPSKTELDSTRATLERAIADNASARAGVNEAQAGLSSDETNLSKASIRAPSDGVVLTRSVDPGNAVAASLQAVTLFTVADDLYKLRLQAYVDEADVGSVISGQKATFTVSAYTNRTYPANITRVAYGSTISDNVVTYLTWLEVDNSDLSLRPGMTASATITATQRNDVLLVPNMALRFTPTSPSKAKSAASTSIISKLTPRMPGRGGSRRSASAGGISKAAANQQVWVLRDGAAVVVEVETGISDGRMTEIIDGELKVGMEVITDQKTVAVK